MERPRLHRKRPITALASILLVAMVAGPDVAHGACREEFGECSMARDCCEGLTCEGGDWSATTDFTCLSKRSIYLQGLGLDVMQAIVGGFYARNAPGVKSDEDIKKLVKRRKGEFPQLVQGLERKYGATVKHDEF